MKLLRSTLLYSTAFMLAACAVGPDFKRPAAPEVKDYSYAPLPSQTVSANVPGGAAQKLAYADTIPAQWWMLFKSTALDKLVEEAIKGNPDLQAANASLRASREAYLAQTGALLPDVDGSAGATRERVTGASFGQPNFPTSIFTLYNASVSVSYGIDIFGGERRAVEAAKAQEDLQRYEMQAAYLTLTSNVVTAAIAEASLREQVKATERIIEVECDQLRVLNAQFELGAIAKSSVLEQQAVVAQQQASLPALQKQLAQKRHQLATLLGRFPSDQPAETFDLETLQLPTDVPVTLPSNLVAQRPDILAAEATLHTASAEIGVATANQLPQITLTGNYGYESTQFRSLINSSTNVWDIGANLTQPIFHGFTLLHQKREAVANYDKAAAQYRSTVLSAFANVADSLRALELDAVALNAQLEAERSSAQSLDLSREQYKDGAIAYAQLLETERTWQQSRIALVQAQAARFADTAALFQALGGGWNAPHTIAVTPAAAAMPTPTLETTPQPELPHFQPNLSSQPEPGKLP